MNKNIEDVDDFNTHCEDVLTYFCESLEGDLRYTRPLTQEEKEWLEDEYPTTTFMYTKKGSELVERYIERLEKIGFKYFDEFDLEISTYMFQDL